MKTKRAEKGIALLSAVLTIAVAAAVSARLLGTVVDQQSRAELFMDADQARLIALNAERIALKVLKDDGENDTNDNLTESWAQDIGTVPLDGGVAAVTIVDVQGRFDLNSLWKDNAFQLPVFLQLQRLFEAANVPVTAASAVAEWESSLVPPVPGAAGDAPYLGASPPYLRAEMPMVGASELRLVDGIDADAYRALAGSVTALPTSMPINVNTAGALVLRSLSSLIDARAAADILKARADAPFSDIAAFRQAVGTAAGLAAASEIPYDRLGVTSAYFVIQVKTTYGAGRATLYSLVHRPKDDDPKVLMRSQAPF